MAAEGQMLSSLPVNWSTLLGLLTPKFYVALTGTSSLVSGLILIFEWWYYRRYGLSFIEQMSVSQRGVRRGAAADKGAETEADAGELALQRNPLALFRGAEYSRMKRTAALTFSDVSLTAQENRAWFSLESYEETAGTGTGAGPEAQAEAMMNRAWREGGVVGRVTAARSALALHTDCAPALLLLAEEQAPTVLEAEALLRRAYRVAEAGSRVAEAGSRVAEAGSRVAEAGSRAAAGAASQGRRQRDAALAAHARLRLAVCARRLGRLREAARHLRDLARDLLSVPPALALAPALAALAPHENLIEVLLEQRAYADLQVLLIRYEEMGVPTSASTYYTNALLRCLSSGGGGGAGGGLGGCTEEALRRALRYNPHVPQYLLELRALAPPAEHVLRRGDSEAVSYAFFHLRHWQAVPGALRALSTAAGASLPAPPLTAPCAAAPAPTALMPAAAALCVLTAMLALCGPLSIRWREGWPEWWSQLGGLVAQVRLVPARLLHLLSAV